MWGSSDTQYLLPDTHPADLLPSNTAVFSSSVRYGKIWHSIVALAFFLFFFFIGISQSGGVSSPSTWLALAFVLPLLCTIPLYFLSKNYYGKAYELSVKNGTWHQGIIIFPSGDLVIRFKGIFTPLDKTIEASYLSRVDVTSHFALHRLWFKQYLNIHYITIEGKAQCITLCETDLRDPPAKIAEYMNNVKRSQVQNGGGF